MEPLVTSFEEACARLNKGTELPDVSTFPDHLKKHVIATYKLATILEVNNGDWKPDLANTQQRKYFPYFRITKGEGSSGFGLSVHVCGYDASYSDLGARLACKDSELAMYMGKTFTDIYIDLHA